MKIKEYYSEWEDNGLRIKCKKCGATGRNECKCFDVVEVKKCDKCGSPHFTNSYGIINCKDCGRLIGIKA